MKKYLLFTGLALAILMAVLLTDCSSNKGTTETQQEYLNLADGVKYVGMQTCQSCHQGVHSTYIHTGMGQSFGLANKEKSAAIYDHTSLVYDTFSNYYYQPSWKNDSLFVTEFRLEGNDTIHQRKEHIAFIVGSGQHTNSHMYCENGYVYQAPVTFYTQEKRWDMAPGFENGYNSRFTRYISLECMSCHNGYPDHVAESVNKYNKIALGIDCERCHGPGEIHVREKLAGNIVDTATEIDYTIVNPGKLPKDKQMSLCQRCHLQGVSVINEDKTWYDFKPGMELSDVVDMFLPRFAGQEDQFIMASQADRLRMSACYQSSEMTCITCHNPHVSIEETAQQTYNNACLKCHQYEHCTVEAERKLADENDCSGCHLPKSHTIDIPHVSITDHFIRKNYDKSVKNLSKEEVGVISEYLTLKCLTQETPPFKTIAQAYLNFYEQFNRQPYLLDSAAYYLYDAEEQTKDRDLVDEWVHYHYLRNDYVNLARSVKEYNEFPITRDWTFYRIGEAFDELGDYKSAMEYFKQALDARPLNLDFKQKLGASYIKLKMMPEAEETYKSIIAENPKYQLAQANLGFLYIIQEKLPLAIIHLEKALELDPDHEKSLLNLARAYHFSGEKSKAIFALKRLLKINPGSPEANSWLEIISTNDL